MSAALPETPDGRYFLAKGRLWRRSDPRLSPAERETLVKALMDARRAVKTAKGAADEPALRAARAAVNVAKTALGERGPVWWDDGAPDWTRHAPASTPYADWAAALAPEPTPEQAPDDEGAGGAVRRRRGRGAGRGSPGRPR